MINFMAFLKLIYTYESNVMDDIGSFFISDLLQGVREGDVKKYKTNVRATQAWIPFYVGQYVDE